MKMKKFLILILCLLISFTAVSCGDEETPSSQSTTSSSTQDTGGNEDNVTVYEVSGKSYLADVSTVNIAWDEDREVTQIQKDTFMALIKTEFKSSTISFSSENSVELIGTNNKSHDFTAQDCDRIDNELFAEIDKKGKIDILIYEDKISFICDFFSGWYFSIDYKLVK